MNKERISRFLFWAMALGFSLGGIREISIGFIEENGDSVIAGVAFFVFGLILLFFAVLELYYPVHRKFSEEKKGRGEEK